MGYIRLKQKENLPFVETYELNDNDYDFFKDFKLPDNINRQTFLKKVESLIAFFENNSGKDLKDQKPWSHEILTKIQNHKDKHEKESFFLAFKPEQLKEIYNYWQNQRK